MASYSIVLDKRVRTRDLPSIPKKDRLRIVSRITKLADDPYPVGSTQLVGNSKRRIRQGNYRILYTVDSSTITICIVKVGHRKDVYN